MWPLLFRSGENRTTMHKCYTFLIFMVLLLPSLGLSRYYITPGLHWKARTAGVMLEKIQLSHLLSLIFHMPLKKTDCILQQCFTIATEPQFQILHPNNLMVNLFLKRGLKSCLYKNKQLFDKELVILTNYSNLYILKIILQIQILPFCVFLHNKVYFWL